MLLKKLLEESELFNSRLEVEISGKEIDYVIINTLRRIIMSEVPVYCWDEFEIKKNESVFNNSYLKEFIRNIPVVGVKDIPTKVPKKKKSVDEIEEEDDGLLDGLIEKDQVDLRDKELKDVDINRYSMYIGYENESNEIKNITTEEAKFYKEGKLIKSPYPNGIILVKLQPGQGIELTVKTRLGLEKEDAKYSPVSVCAYNELEDNKFKFFLESRGLYNEKDLLKLGCVLIIRKLLKIGKMFPDSELLEGEINIPKEDYTVGNLLSHGLYKLSEVSYATFMKKHILDNEIIIKYGLKKEMNIKKLVERVINDYKLLFENLERSLSKL